MNRKWRLNPGALDTVASYPAFRAAIPAADAPYALASPTDLYAVYSVLHIEGKAAELRWSPHGRFFYFLVQWEVAAGAAPAPAAPEGDEDPPPQILPEGSAAALAQEAAAQQQQQQQQGGGKKRRTGGGGAAGQQQQEQQPEQQQGQQTEQQQGQQQPQEQPGQQQDVQQAEAPAAAAAAEAAGNDAEAATAAPPATRLRTQIVVPLSSASRELTPALLQRFFSVRGVQAQQLLLAMVDSNGVVTRSCLYNYIQAPLEGPGTANLELLDD